MSRAEKRLFIMKRFAAMLLVVAMAFACLFAFAGCGNNDKGNTTKGSADGSETGVASGTFNLGGIGPLTGDAAIYGTAVMNGAQIAVDEINANGGIGGQTLVMKTYDTKGDVTEAVNAYITAVTVDKVALIVGPPVANIANAIKETSEDYDVPVVGLAMDPSCQLKADGTLQSIVDKYITAE